MSTRPKQAASYELAMAAGRQAADRQMRKAGRKEWNQSDYAVAVKTFSRHMGGTAGVEKKLGVRLNPADPISMFAQLAGGLASALTIDDMLRKRAAKKKTTRRKNPVRKIVRRAKANPRAKVRKLSRGDHYLLTIGTGDDIMAVYLHDGKKDGFEKRFKTLAGARAFATKNKIRVQANPKPVTRKRNIMGFMEGGTFHPIRASVDYDDVRAGESSRQPHLHNRLLRASKALKKRVGIRPQQGRLFNPKAKKNAWPPSEYYYYVNGIFIDRMSTPPSRVKAAWKTTVIKQSKRGDGIRVDMKTTAKSPAWLKHPLARSLNPKPKAKARNGTQTQAEKAFAKKKANPKHAGGPKSRKRTHGLRKLTGMRGRSRRVLKKVSRRKVQSRAASNSASGMVRKHKARNPKAVPRRRTFEMFQGRKSERMLSVPVSRLAPKRLDQLGDLVEIKINGGPTLKFNGKRVRLCAANGRLWIAGRRFARPDAKQPARIVNPIGEIDHVVYGTHKPHHGDHRYTYYIHRLGEETGHRPVLCVDREGFPVIRGGKYKIEARGIVN